MHDYDSRWEEGRELEDCDPPGGTIVTRAPDDPDGTVHRVAPPEIERAIQRRFESRPVVVHPDKPDVYIYDPGNFWDGPTHVRYEPPTGTFYFESWGGSQRFPMVGPIQ